jgi:hypothetical protein
MKCCYILLFFVLFSQVLSAQNLLPFLGKNGKYGFAEESGKIIIAPEFEGHIEPFFKETLAIDCRKNGETVRLFRSGLIVPNPRLMMSRLLPVLNFDENDVRMDSIGHLAAVRVEQKMRIIHLREDGKMVESYLPDYLNLPKWAKLRESSDGSGFDFRFHHGLARLFRADGRVNFADENFREILPKDVAAGVVADAQHLIFAESEGRFGVADRSGKTVVAPVFRSLEPSGKTGFFIANKHRDGFIGEKWSCGLVRSDGKIVLDTVYSDIEKVAGADLFIVKNVGKTGLFDFEGHEIVPIEAEYGYKQDFGFSIFKWPNGGANLFDRRGKRLLEKNAAEVTPVKFSNKLFFKIKAGGWTSVLDTSMTVLARDSVENLDLVEADPPLFMVRKNANQSRLVSIRDAAGRTLVEGKFDGVWSAPGWPDGLRFIYLNNLKGIADHYFNEILPPMFEEIALEEGRRDTFIWAKKQGDALFMAFDKRGIRRADIDDAPEPRRESAFGVIAKMQALPGGGNMATMFDGTQIKWPDSLKNQRVWGGFRSQTGGAVAVGFDPKRITTVLDHRFRNLLPAGFGVPERTANETVLERFQQFGLLVVQKLPDVKPVAPPAPRPKTKPVEPVKRTAGAPELVTSDAPEEYPISSEGRGMGKPAQKTEPMPGAACGVLDLEGNWLLEPKTGVEYLVLSPFLVAEFPAGARSSSYQFFENGLRLHRVQQTEKGFFEANWLGRDRFSREEGNNMKIGRIRKGTTRLAEYAYFDQKGKPVTDWIFENGPDFLTSKNLVHIWEKDVYGVRQAVINENGKTIFELGDWMTEDSPRNRGGDNDKWTHLIIQKRRDEILKDTLGRLIPMPKGLMDSTGRVVLPPEFSDLHIWEKYRYLNAKTTAGNFVLMTMDGRKIHEFKPCKSSILMQHIGRGPKHMSSGPLAVWTENETVLIDDNNAVIRHFDLPFGREVLSEELAEQFVVLIKNNQKVWANYRSGRLFAE